MEISMCTSPTGPKMMMRNVENLTPSPEKEKDCNHFQDV
jgi:hypothetical protein